jgi:hypothetical protein
MKIISKNRDYYDSAIGYGIDKERIFVRKSSTHSLPRDIDPIYIKGRKATKTRMINYTGYCLGYCGELIPIVLLQWEKGNDHNYNHYYGCSTVDNYCYTADDVSKKAPDLPTRRTFYGPEPISSKEWWDSAVENMQRFKPFFKDYNCAYFLVAGDEVELYPNLERLCFARLKDPYTAYQEIATYLFNDLAGDTKVHVPTGDDKVVAASKGFGHKYAFRKEPGTGRKGKKCN